VDCCSRNRRAERGKTGPFRHRGATVRGPAAEEVRSSSARNARVCTVAPIIFCVDAPKNSARLRRESSWPSAHPAAPLKT
jgi:hypothetical protein